ncbi:MAG: pyruvate kinase [Candidatus Eisenbacteria bacterium]|nr:pyruvate kinase [Candidatus Eisenbacteria bacterium]
MHRTRIVATVGPACGTASELGRMIQAGVDVFRFNLSHGNHASHAEAIAKVRAAAERLDRPIGILLDLQGPKVRTGKNTGGDLIPLRRGDRLQITCRRGLSRPGEIVVDYPGLVRDLRAGDRVLIDDGRLSLLIERKERSGSRRGSCAAACSSRAPASTCRLVASRCRSRPRRTARTRSSPSSRGPTWSPSPLFAPGRMSRTSAACSPAARPSAPCPWSSPRSRSPPPSIPRRIIAVSDGVMVARGDLGVELSLERVPIWQKEILERARRAGVFGITATQMLESMVASATPTRAEVSDVANAIYDGTDAVMLSGETASGQYPIESVRMLARIAREAEQHLDLASFDQKPSARNPADSDHHQAFAMVEAAKALAERAHAKKIVVFTLTGNTARLLASRRPTVEIIALTPNHETRRRLSLAWNTRTLHLQGIRNTDQMMQNGIHLVRREGLVRRGDTIVLLAGPTHLAESTNLLRLVEA